jgi:hypothetical protein
MSQQPERDLPHDPLRGLQPGSAAYLARVDELEDAEDAAEADAAMDEPGESIPLAELVAELARLG